MIRARRWIAALIGMIVLCAVTAVVVDVVAAQQQLIAENWFGQLHPEDPSMSPEEFEYYNDIYLLSDRLRVLATPLLLVAVAGTAVLLAVLSARRDAPRRHAARGPVQAEATAAS